jgi:hypothetical protein
VHRGALDEHAFLGSWVRGHKYHAKKTTIDGIVFASMAESRRYKDLKLLLKGGAIRELVLQPRFPITINGIKVCDVVLDFQYSTNKGFIYEDVKSDPTNTPLSRLKRKMLQAQYGITVTLIKP